MEPKPIEVSALGRPLYPGMLYDCRNDSFIPGVTLWDKKSLLEDVDPRTQLSTDVKFSSSDSLSGKTSLMNISTSLKASFMGGLVDVGGSAKYLHDTKSTNHVSRVTMFYSETTRFEQLTMTNLSKFTYPQVFDQQTATHVVTAVLYGAQAFMVFDWTFSEDEDKQQIEGQLNVMVKKIPAFSIEGAVKMNDDNKKTAEKISCTFHGDFHLEQNPTTYMEALQLYKQLPNLLKDNPQNVVPVKVWLYPLYLLDTKAARLMREISTSLVSSTEAVMEDLEEAERRCNDLFSRTLVNVFSDIKERLSLFQSLFRTYKLVLQKALARVLPAIREGGEEQSLVDILQNHMSSPFNASIQWLNDTKSELDILKSYTKSLKGIKAVDAHGLSSILLNPDIDVVVCLNFTSLKYDDPYLSTLKEFLKSDKFKKLEGNKNLHFVQSAPKWFNDPNVITRMRKTLTLFKSFSEANKDDTKMCFIISAISDDSNVGSSIYLYKQDKLSEKNFQPVSKPPALIVKSVQKDFVSLTLQKSLTGENVQYRVEYKEWYSDNKPGFFEDKNCIVTNTYNENINLIGLQLGKQYLIQYRIVSKVGVSEPSDCVSLSLAPPVTVGGTGGDAFCSIFDSTIQKISIYYLKRERFQLMVLTLNNGSTITHGYKKADGQAEFVFDRDDKIITATLWPNKNRDRAGGLEFEILKSNGERRLFSVKCEQLGEPVRLDVKSGTCFGITGRSGAHIDALGFYFF